MGKTWIWVGAFLALYGLHAFFFLTYQGRIDALVTPDAARAGSIVTLVALTLLIAAFAATRDEVFRRIAMQAGAASAIATGFFSYGLSAFNIDAPLIASNIWALAIFVFLLAYGALSWLARS